MRIEITRDRRMAGKSFRLDINSGKYGIPMYCVDAQDLLDNIITVVALTFKAPGITSKEIKKSIDHIVEIIQKSEAENGTQDQHENVS